MDAMGFSYMPGGANYGGGGGTDWWKLLAGNGQSTPNWGAMGPMLAGFGQQIGGGGQQMPRQTGWEWQTFNQGYGPGGNNLNPWSEGQMANLNNLAAQGGAGMYDAWSSKVMNPLTQMVSGLTGDYQKLLEEQVRRSVAPALETATQNYGYSGAAQQAMSQEIGQKSLDALLQGQNAKLSLLSQFAPMTYQGALSLTQMQNQFAAPEFVAPTLTPTYEEPKETQWWQKMLSGAMSGAGMGTAVAPGVGTLIGGGIGALAGLLM